MSEGVCIIYLTPQPLLLTGKAQPGEQEPCTLDVIGNKILELPAQMMLAMANAQIVQTGCRFHETI